ncbi:hypothetical protein M2352_002923 [Azospirillum fermentarium]|uniref:hypothetical protein n=1 Tax=Azospirillum fermentarium TaxID=1233114 RepID=UPI002227DFA0|nr:hypothetical protein [Azospirillum fermentarium]MCW2247332.1 hypothetical protein [Azospirillum fermentarium]
MSVQRRGTHDAHSRDRLESATRRLDDLRSIVERLRSSEDRGDFERTLDSLRGQHNRALARLEAARLALPDSWPLARAQADQALDDLTRGLDEVERRLQQKQAA